MREINTQLITKTIEELCIDANKNLSCDLACRIKECSKNESYPLAKGIMEDIEKNLVVANQLDIPICQDTGMAVVFIEIGQDVHFTGGSLNDAINKGVHDGYINGLLRCSVVADPIKRGNTNDNTPAIIHTKIVDGDKVKITVAPKGFGSENMSRIKMFTPSAKEQDIVDFIVETAKIAGGNPCPPMVLGVGIGGDFEYCATLSKIALCRNVEISNPDDYYKELEAKCLQAVNKTNVGPQGFGGDTTALAVNIETYPTHIAGLPVAVNVGCHVTRHKTKII